MKGYDIAIEPIADAAWITVRADNEAVPALEAALGGPFPREAGTSARGGAWTLLTLSPDEWLIRTGAGHEMTTWRALRDAARGTHAAVTVVSDHYAGFRLRGDDVLAILRQGMSIDLEVLGDGAHARCAFARTSALLCVVGYARQYELFVESSYADYAALWLEVAAGRGH